VFDELSAGAENDLQQATKIARRMVTHWGMSERIGPVAYRTSEEHPFLGKEFHEQREFSEHTAQVIDEEVARILRAASERALEMLTSHREQLDKLSNALEEQEEINETDMERLLGPSASNLARRNGKPAKKTTELTADSVSTST
jgi:cell division protease FtsH